MRAWGEGEGDAFVIGVCEQGVKEQTPRGVEHCEVTCAACGSEARRLLRLRPLQHVSHQLPRSACRGCGERSGGVILAEGLAGVWLGDTGRQLPARIVCTAFALAVIAHMRCTTGECEQ